MGKKRGIKFFVLISSLLVTYLIINSQPTSKQVNKNYPLLEAVSKINGWKITNSIPLEEKIIEALKLDDHVNLTYTNGKDNVTLYIGYYKTAEKVGAAHDPTVCFMGQGWEMSKTTTGQYKFNYQNKNIKISYSQFSAKKGQRNELILFWFQAHDKTNSGTFQQKLSTFWNQLTKGVDDNAFVRISIIKGKRLNKESREVVFQFIKDFYPVFLEYVKNG